jgi:uncharacterized protein (TIGR03086 family)
VKPAYRERVTSQREELAVLSRSLDQAAAILGQVSDDDLSAPTPCHEWRTAELVDHLVEAPARFARMMRGEEVDWAAPTPHAGDDRAGVFRAHADDLIGAWLDLGDRDAPMPPDWQSAELAVHTYDLATAIGHSTGDLDPEVAERGLAFMQSNLTPANRAPAFEAEQPAPDRADAYQRIAAFAGRTITPRR